MGEAMVTMSESIFDDSNDEACRHRWIESEKAGHDLGSGIYFSWFRQHWNRYVRSRYIEHVLGHRFWRELDLGDYGIVGRLKESFAYRSDCYLIDQILCMLSDGKENLDILIWSKNHSHDIEFVLQVLERLDINSRRLENRFAG